MKLYQFDKEIYVEDYISQEDYIWHFLIINNKALFAVYFRRPSNVIHVSGGINILLSLFGSSSLLGIDFQQEKFELAFYILCDYFSSDKKTYD